MKRENTVRRKNAGFTLIELIVVLILVSVVSAIAVPTYLGYVDDSHAKQCLQNRQRLASYLDDMRITDSSATMETVLQKHTEIECPQGGIYNAFGDNTVYCSVHDVDESGKMKDGTTIIAKNDSGVSGVDELLKNPPTEAAREVTPTPTPGETPTPTPDETPTPTPDETPTPTPDETPTPTPDETPTPTPDETPTPTPDETPTPTPDETPTPTPSETPTPPPPTNSSGGDLLVNVPNPLKINGGTGCDMGQYVKAGIMGGQWSVVSGPAQFNENSSYLAATGPGFCRLRYTLGTNVEEIEAEVVYPHTYFGTDPNYEFFMEIDEEKAITAQYGGYNDNTYFKGTTDEPVEWVITEGAELISYHTDGEKNSVAHIKALGVGTVKIAARLQNGFTGEWEQTNPVPIQIKYKKITQITAQSVEVQEDAISKIQIAYTPSSGIDPSQLTITYDSQDSNIATVSSEGIVLGKREGNCIIKVTANGNEQHITTDCQVTVTENPNRIKEISVEPDPFCVRQGESAQIIPKYQPQNADTNVRYELVRLESWKNLLEVNGTTVTAGNNLGDERIKVTARKDDIELASCEFTVKIIENPTILNGISINPKTISLDVGSQAKIAKNTDQDVANADVIVSPSTAEASLNDAEITYSSSSEEHATVEQNGVITGKNAGNISITVKARRKSDGTEFSESFTVIVMPTSFQLDGQTIDAVSWNTLRKHMMKNGEADWEPLQMSQLYLDYVNAWTQTIYLLKPDTELPWKPEYENLTSFAEYLNKVGTEYFIQVKVNEIKRTSWGGVQWCPNGAILERNGNYYVYTGNDNNIDFGNLQNETEEKLLEKGFIKISP